MPYLFTPPGERRPVGTSLLWARFQYPVSFTLLKKGGFYTLTETPADEDVSTADVAYLAGHSYLVTNAEAAALTAAGYSVTSGFGTGDYGVGVYGSPAA